jgi:hypothetical protein
MATGRARRRWTTGKVGTAVGIALLAGGALLVPAAVSATPGFSGPGFTPALVPSNVGVKCAPGAQYGVSVAAVKIGIHRVGPGHLGKAETITVYGLPGARYTLQPPHFTASIPKGTRMPCGRGFNQGTWVPNAKHSRIATKWLHYTHCASPHC